MPLRPLYVPTNGLSSFRILDESLDLCIVVALLPLAADFLPGLGGENDGLARFAGGIALGYLLKLAASQGSWMRVNSQRQ